MKVHFSERGWEDYRHWAGADGKIFTRVSDLIEEVRRTPFAGTGKPEPLKGALAGFWSRRITGEHRLVYAVEGKATDQRVTVVACRYHY